MDDGLNAFNSNYINNMADNLKRLNDLFAVIDFSGIESRSKYNKTILEIYRHGMKILNKVSYWTYSFEYQLFRVKLFKKFKRVEELKEEAEE